MKVNITNDNHDIVEKLMTELNTLLSNSECISVTDLDNNEYHSLLERIKNLQNTIGFLLSDKFNGALITMQTFLDGQNTTPDADFPSENYFSTFELKYKVSRSKIWFSVNETAGFKDKPESISEKTVFGFVSNFSVENILIDFNNKVKAAFVII